MRNVLDLNDEKLKRESKIIKKDTIEIKKVYYELNSQLGIIRADLPGALGKEFVDDYEDLRERIEEFIHLQSKICTGIDLELMRKKDELDITKD